ncbi:hypothetical protein MRX96_014451 [Rhipicephalus microplus]
MAAATRDRTDGTFRLSTVACGAEPLLRGKRSKEGVLGRPWNFGPAAGIFFCPFDISLVRAGESGRCCNSRLSTFPSDGLKPPS